MIDVYVQDVDSDVRYQLGLFSPKHIDDVIALVKRHGASLGGEELEFLSVNFEVGERLTCILVICVANTR